MTAAAAPSIYRNGQDAFSQKRKPERKEETIFQTNFVIKLIPIILPVSSLAFCAFQTIHIALEPSANCKAKHLSQALFLCNICVVFRPVLAFRDLLFIHASTNATDDHKYSPLPSADFDSSGVLVSFSAFIFS